MSALEGKSMGDHVCNDGKSEARMTANGHCQLCPRDTVSMHGCNGGPAGAAGTTA